MPSYLSLCLYSPVPPPPASMLNVCQTILQKKSPLKSNIEKGGGEENKSMVKCDNLPNKIG